MSSPYKRMNDDARSNARNADQMGYPVLPGSANTDSVLSIPRGVAVQPSIHYGEPVE